MTDTAALSRHQNPLEHAKISPQSSLIIRRRIKHRTFCMDKTNRRIVSLLVIGMAFLISACNATTKPATEAAIDNWANVANKDWQLIRIQNAGRTIDPMSPILASVNFTLDGKIVGSTGCNRYFGGYTRDGNNLMISALGSANMMCVDDAMDVEDAFIAAMADVKSWKIDQGELLLLDATDKSLMKLEPITP
tara:strand:+ start:37128 stop:37703 length:576 start_codon:yes stop_codon:yes gene_type:complete